MKIWSKIRVVYEFRYLVLASGFFVGGFSNQSLGSGDSACHFHGDAPAAEATVIKCADQHKARLIKKGTIADSWTSINHNTVEQIGVGAGKKEWKLTFKDSNAKDKAKETLYMFFSIPGNFLASNFTGK